MVRKYDLALVCINENNPKNSPIKNLFRLKVQEAKIHTELQPNNYNAVPKKGLYLADMLLFSVLLLAISRIPIGRCKIFPKKFEQIIENHLSSIEPQSSMALIEPLPVVPESVCIRKYWFPSPAFLTLISGLSFWGICIYLFWILLKYLTKPFKKVFDLISVIGTKTYTILEQSIPSESIALAATMSGKIFTRTARISSFIVQPDLAVEAAKKCYIQKLEDKASIEEFMLSAVALQTIAGIYHINLSHTNNGSFFIDSLDNLFVDLEIHKIVESSLASQIIKKLDLANTTSTQELFQYLKGILKLDFLPVAEALNTNDDDMRIQTEKMRIYSLIKGFKQKASEIVAPPKMLVRFRKGIEDSSLLESKGTTLILLPFVLAFIYKYQMENPIATYVTAKLTTRIPKVKKFLKLLGKVAKPFNGDPQTLNPLIESFKEHTIDFLSGNNCQTKFILTKVLPGNLIELIELPLILMYIPKVLRAASHGAVMLLIYIEHCLRERNKSNSPMHQEAKKLWEKAKNHTGYNE
jgi:hypothetical protein